MEVTYPATASSADQQPLNAATPVQLSAEATPTTYILTLTQGSYRWGFSFDAEDLCIMPPVGGAFTGTMFGIYSFGAWEPVLDPADFSNIRIEEQNP